MKINSWQKAIFAGLGAQIIWGVAGPLVKIVLYSVPPISLLFLRALFTTLVLFVVYEIKWSKEFHLPVPRKGNPMPRKDIRDIFLAGFFGVFVNIALYFWGQKLTTVIDTWTITSTAPLFVALYCFFFEKERLSKIVYSGIGLAFLGTLVVIGTPILQVGSGSMFGNVLLLGATLAGSVNVIITKRLVAKYPPLLLTFYSFLIALFFTFPFFIWEFIQNPAWLGALPLSAYLIILYLIIGSSILAYYLTNFSLKGLSPSIYSTIGYASTIISIALSILFLGEKPTVYFMIGAGLIALGLFFAESRHPNHPLHDRKS